jgi:hypothetical protein
VPHFVAFCFKKRLPTPSKNSGSHQFIVDRDRGAFKPQRLGILPTFPDYQIKQQGSVKTVTAIAATV